MHLVFSSTNPVCALCGSSSFDVCEASQLDDSTSIALSHHRGSDACMQTPWHRTHSQSDQRTMLVHPVALRARRRHLQSVSIALHHSSAGGRWPSEALFRQLVVIGVLQQTGPAHSMMPLLGRVVAQHVHSQGRCRVDTAGWHISLCYSHARHGSKNTYPS